MPAGGFVIIEGNTFGSTTGLNDIIDFTGAARPGPILQILNNVSPARAMTCSTWMPPMRISKATCSCTFTTATSRPRILRAPFPTDWAPLAGPTTRRASSRCAISSSMWITSRSARKAASSRWSTTPLLASVWPRLISANPPGHAAGRRCARRRQHLLESARLCGNEFPESISHQRNGHAHRQSEHLRVRRRARQWHGQSECRSAPRQHRHRHHHRNVGLAGSCPARRVSCHRQRPQRSGSRRAGGLGRFDLG